MLVSKSIPSDLMVESLKRLRKLQALVNRTEANLSLIKSRAITKEEANEFLSSFLQMYNYSSDLESSFFDFWHNMLIDQINNDISFSEEDSASISSLLSKI